MNTANISKIGILFLGWMLALQLTAHATTYTASDFNASPPLITDSTDPFVMINLSVELTQQAEAYTDGAQTLLGGTVCGGRQNVNVAYDAPNSDTIEVGICYSSSETYLGYFDSEKCYEYVPTSNTGSVQAATGPNNTASADPSYFRPIGPATNHRCTNRFSGNFMNWATMTALDEFRYAMTGGARLVDTVGANAKTLLTRTHRYGDWGFVTKRIRSSGTSQGGATFTNDPDDVTEINESQLYIVNNYADSGNRVRFYDASGNPEGEYNVIVEVCNKTVGVESNCVEYTDGTNTWYKPEGVMQKNAQNMRFALTSYSAQDGNVRNGGVLRANAKYIGYLRPKTGGGLEVNPNAEVNQYGQFVYNPDSVTIAAGVNNSGILNYINGFGLGPERYKSNDPVAELFYEGLRYFKNLGPTPEYSGASGTLAALTNNQKDNFPVITSWNDPIADACQANYMVAIGDQFSWGDASLPGASVNDSGVPSVPSNADSDIVADTLTNRVGTLENYYPGTLATRTRGGRDNNGWHVAGLAYYANTNDIRDDRDGFQHIKTFFIDTQEYNSNPPTKQANPLWMAAKYGGFKDENGDGDPGNGQAWGADTYGPRTDEWDADNDGHPDTYTLASQPANLIKGLNNAFNEIAGEVRAGSSAGLSVNGTQGVGVVVRGLFKPKHVKDNNTVEWVGLLQALLVDKFLNLREDTNGDGAITNADKIIKFVVGDNKATVSRYVTTNGGETMTLDQEGVEIEAIDSLWEGRDELAKLTNLTTQRTYGASANTGRYIISSLDADKNGISVNSEQVDFVADTFIPEAVDSDSTDDPFRLLGLNNSTKTKYADIVNYIRGDETITGFRSRTIDYDNDGVAEPWILGDIINSSPLIVGAPRLEDRYDIQYKDETYTAFYEKYNNRRQVVYTGGNDGMLHAFNGGFYDRNTTSFKTSLTSETSHPLGSELWAYVPYNSLPHLQWLTTIDYPHVYYVDGVPQSFDVNIFPNDADHPNGWGTILVVGMRFGGGEYTLDPNSDTDADLADDITLRSSYLVFDVTNPESAPKLLAEISHPELGYTTTRPTLMFNRKPNLESGSYTSPSANDWYLAFGSGPFGNDATSRALALDDAVSNQNAKLFAFDLKTKSFAQFDDGFGGTVAYKDVTGGTNGFAGDFQSADWDRDYTSDVAYFGLVTGDVGTPGGALMRFKPGSNFSITTGGFTQLLTGITSQPFMGQPHVLKKGKDNWVFTGSGRYLVSDDSLSTGQMGFYGIKDNAYIAGTAASLSAMLDVTGIYAQFVNPDSQSDFSGALLYDENGNPPVSNLSSETMETFKKLAAEVKPDSVNGWYIEFQESGERVVGRTDSNGETVLYRSYVPSTDACNPAGESYTNSSYYATGTAPPFGSVAGTRTNLSGVQVVEQRIMEGFGLIRDVYVDDQGIISGGTGIYGDTKSPQEAPKSGTPAGRMSWREIQINW